MTDINVTVAPPAALTIGFSAGQQGVAGPPGPTGPAGPTGPTGPMGSTYTYTQSSASALWRIAHNLGRYPSVTIVDSSGREVEGDPDYIDANTISIAFSAPFGGVAYLN